MGLGNNSSSKIRSANFESADHLEPEVRRVIQSLQDTVRNLQDEVNSILKNATPDSSVIQKNSTNLSIEGGQGIKIASICNRRIISSTYQPSSGVTLVVNHFSVVSVLGDYLVCQTITSGDPQTIYVAKPYWFRETTWDGAEIDGIIYGKVYDEDAAAQIRSANNEQYSEEQYLIPNYFQGEIITAILSHPEIYTEQDELILWEDINAAGRAWGADFTSEIKVE